MKLQAFFCNKGVSMESMPVNISIIWDDEEHTMIRYIFSKGWGWKEFNQVFQQAYEMMDTVNHRVSDILDFTNASLFIPPQAILQGRHIMNNERHPNLGMTVIVGSMFVHNIYNVVKQITGKDPAEKWDVAFVKRLPEAYEVISRYNLKKDHSKD